MKVERVECENDLGINLEICIKASQRIGSIRRTLTYMNEKMFLILHKSIFVFVGMMHDF